MDGDDDDDEGRKEERGWCLLGFGSNSNNLFFSALSPPAGNA